MDKKIEYGPGAALIAAIILGVFYLAGLSALIFFIVWMVS